MDTLVYVEPFLKVVRSEETSGPITGVALTSIQKFLSSFISERSINVEQAMAAIGHAVTHCRFEATDPDSDEVVLMKILHVLLACTRGPAGPLISGSMVYDMVQTCWRMTFQVRLSELLRKTAEYTLQEMILTVFVRYGDYDPDRHAMEIAAENPDRDDDEKAVQLEVLAEDEINKVDNEQSGADETSNVEDTREESQPDAESDDNSASDAVKDGEKQEARDTEQQESGEQADGEAVTVSVAESELAAKKDLEEINSSRPIRKATGSLRGSLKVSQPVKPPFVNPRGVRFERLLEERRRSALRSPSPTPIAEHGSLSPYGVNCLTRLFGFLCDLVHPTGQHPVELRTMGLLLINSLLEHRGISLQKFPPLLERIRDTVCHCLVQSLHTDDLTVLTLSLRVMFNLFHSMKQHLKVELGILFQAILGIISKQQASYEQQEVILESLAEFCRLPCFAIDLYVNFDNDLHGPNLFENLCKVLYKNAFPVSGSLYTIHLLSLDCLMSVVHTLVNRIDEPELLGCGPPIIPCERLAECRQTKQVLLEAAEKFNNDVKDGLDFLTRNRLVPNPPDADSIAHVLRTLPALDKALVGEYIGKNKPFNIEVLKAYVETFTHLMNGRDTFLPAVRQFMESMRVPGEAQVIGRVLEAFAAAWMRHGNEDGTFDNEDAVYLLAYSVVMLNVDQHNPKVKKPMKITDFMSMLRGTNGGRDFDHGLLTEVFESIRNDEITIPEEASLESETIGSKKVVDVGSGNGASAGGTGSSGNVPLKLWHDLRKSGAKMAPFVSTMTAAYDRDIFGVIWRPLIAALSVIFDTSYDDGMVAKALDGFKRCSRVAAHFEMGDVFDNVIITLCKFSGLLSVNNVTEFFNSFGRSAKAQKTAVALFTTATLYVNHLREGWRNLLSCVVNLNSLGQLSHSILSLPPIYDPEDMPHAISRVKAKPKASGLLAYWFGGETASAPSTPPGGGAVAVSETATTPTRNAAVAELGNDAENPTLRYIVSCVDECKIGELLNATTKLSDEGIVYLVKTAILAAVAAPESTTAAVGAPNAAGGSQIAVNLAGLRRRARKDPEVFCLELLAKICLDNKQRVHLIWPFVQEHFQGVLGSCREPTAVVEEATTLLLTLAVELAGAGEMTDAVVSSLTVMLNMSPEVEAALAEHIAIGVTRLLQRHRAALSLWSTTAWESALSLVKMCSRRKRACRRGCEVLQWLVHDTNHELGALVLPSNFSFYISATHAYVQSRIGTQCIEGLEVLYALHSNVLPMLGFSRELELDDRKRADTWTQYWLPVLRHMSHACRDARADVRNAAMMILQRSLLSEDLLVLGPHGWYSCFEQVLFPLSDELLTATVDPKEAENNEHVTVTDVVFSLFTSERRHANPLEETRLRAAALLCKVFLHYASSVEPSPEFNSLWLKLLHYVERYMVAEESDALAEAVTESLKNLLLILMSSGILREEAADGGDDMARELWNSTWSTIHKFCPELTPQMLQGVVAKRRPPPPMSPPTVHLAMEAENDEIEAVPLQQLDEQEDQDDAEVEVAFNDADAVEENEDEGEDDEEDSAIAARVSTPIDV